MTSYRSRLRLALAALAPAIALGACDRAPEDQDDHAHVEDHAPAPTNRVDIPDAVRRNLGITFARVEPRNVERVLRVPGRFELLPTARREYRAPLDGTVELLVQPQQSVDAGTPLYRLRSAEWQRLVQDAAAARARVESMVPMKAALDAQELSQRERLKVWQERLSQLERIRDAGGGSAAQFAEARTQFSAAQAELAAVSVRMAELESAHRVAEADLAARDAQVKMIRDAAGCAAAGDPAPAELVVCASVPGRVELVAVTQGGRVDASAMVAATVDPDGVWFRARALQSDLGRLADGMRAAVAPPSGGSLESQPPIAGSLRVGATADADGRTIDLYLMPVGGAGWARSGVAAALEVTLEDAPEELAIPLSAVVRDGAKPVIFRRDPANPDRAIRLDADLGPSDGRWIAVLSGVREGDEVVVAGAYQLMLSMSGSSPKGGHFHADGTFHADDH
jgi:cobalt-zinc-cadmium efflux system membrane fusion protein